MEEKRTIQSLPSNSTINTEPKNSNNNNNISTAPLIIDEIYEKLKIYYQDKDMQNAQKIITENFNNGRLNDVFSAIQMIVLKNLNNNTSSNEAKFIDFQFLFECLMPNLCENQKSILVIQKSGLFSFLLRTLYQQSQQKYKLENNINEQTKNQNPNNIISNNLIILLTFFKGIHIKAPRFLSLLTEQDYSVISDFFDCIQMNDVIFDLMLSILLRKNDVDENFYEKIKDSLFLSLEKIIKDQQQQTLQAEISNSQQQPVQTENNETPSTQPSQPPEIITASIPLHSLTITNSNLLKILFLKVYKSSPQFYSKLEDVLIVLNLHFEFNRSICFDLLPYLFESFPQRTKLLSYIASSYIKKSDFDFLMTHFFSQPSFIIQFLSDLIKHTNVYSKSDIFMIQIPSTEFLEVKEFHLKNNFSMRFYMKFLSLDRTLLHIYNIISKEYLKIHLGFCTEECAVQIEGRNLTNEQEFSTLYNYTRGTVGINLFEWAEFCIIYMPSYLRIVINDEVKFDIPMPEMKDRSLENQHIQVILENSFVEISEICFSTIEQSSSREFLSFVISPCSIEKNDEFATIDTKFFKFHGLCVKGLSSLQECFISCGGLEILYNFMRKFDNTKSYLMNFLNILSFVIKSDEEIFMNSQFFRKLGHFFCCLNCSLIDSNFASLLFCCFPKNKENRADFVTNVLLNFSFLSRFPESVLSISLRTNYFETLQTNPASFCCICSFKDCLVNFLSFTDNAEVIDALWLSLFSWAKFSFHESDALSIIGCLQESESNSELFECHLRGLSNLLKIESILSIFKKSAYFETLLLLLSLRSEVLRIKSLLVILTHLPKQFQKDVHLATAIRYLTQSPTTTKLTTINIFNALFSAGEIAFVTDFHFTCHDDNCKHLSLPQILPIFGSLLHHLGAEQPKYSAFLGDVLLRSPPIQYESLRCCENWVFWFLFFMKIDGRSDVWMKVFSIAFYRFIHDELIDVYLNSLIILANVLDIRPRDFPLLVLTTLLNDAVEGQDKTIVAFRIIVNCLFVPSFQTNPSNIDSTEETEKRSSQQNSSEGMQLIVESCESTSMLSSSSSNASFSSNSSVTNSEVLSNFNGPQKVTTLSELVKIISEVTVEDVNFEFLAKIKENQRIIFSALSVLLHIPSGIDILVKFDTINRELNSLKLSSFLITRLYEVNPINSLILLHSFLKLVKKNSGKADSQNLRISLLILVKTFEGHHLFGNVIKNELVELFNETLSELDKNCQEVLKDNDLNLRFNMDRFKSQFNSFYKEFIESLTESFEITKETPEVPKYSTALNLASVKSDQLFYKSAVPHLHAKSMKMHKIGRSNSFQIINNYMNRSIVKRVFDNDENNNRNSDEFNLYRSETTFAVKYIRVKKELKGILSFIENYFIFIGENGKVIEIPSKQIDFILSRCNLRLEFFEYKKSSFLFQFKGISYYSRFINILRSKGSFFQKIITFDGAELLNVRKFTQQWEKGMISNYEYLVWINICAGRTFNDVGCYPLFPYVIADLRSDKLKFKMSDTFRNFMQNQQNSDFFAIDKVCLILNGLYPFSTFSVNSSSFSEKLSRMSEVPPELYTTPCAFANESLPSWSYGKQNSFVLLNQCALESLYITNFLNLWIDEAFGINQRPNMPSKNRLFQYKDKDKQNNSSFSTYCDPCLKLALACEAPSRLPLQIFFSKHPQQQFIVGPRNFGLKLVPHTTISSKILSMSTLGSKLYILLSDGYLTILDILGRKIEKSFELKFLRRWEIDKKKCFILPEWDLAVFVPENANYFISAIFAEKKKTFLRRSRKMCGKIKMIASDDSKIVAVVSEDNSIAVYDLRSNSIMAVITEHKSEITSAVISSNMGIIVSTSIIKNGNTTDLQSCLIVISKIDSGKTILKEVINNNNRPNSTSNQNDDENNENDIRVKRTILTDHGFVVLVFDHRIELRDMSLKLVNTVKVDCEKICLLDVPNKSLFIAVSCVNRILFYRLYDMKMKCIIDIPEYKPQKLIFSKETKKFICVVAPPSSSSIFISDVLS